MVSKEQSVELVASETGVLGKNLPQCALYSTNSSWHDPSSNPGRRVGGLSYGTPHIIFTVPEANQY